MSATKVNFSASESDVSCFKYEQELYKTILNNQLGRHHTITRNLNQFAIKIQSYEQGTPQADLHRSQQNLITEIEEHKKTWDDFTLQILPYYSEKHYKMLLRISKEIGQFRSQYNALVARIQKVQQRVGTLANLPSEAGPSHLDLGIIPNAESEDVPECLGGYPPSDAARFSPLTLGYGSQGGTKDTSQ